MHTDYAENKRWILDRNFTDKKDILEQTDENGQTALWISVAERNQKCVELLLAYGARIDIFNSEGKSLLETAAKIPDKHHAEVSKSILGLLQAVDASQRALAAINDIVDFPKNKLAKSF